MSSEIQEQIEQRQEFDVRAVTRLNEVFYQAFTKQDTAVMSQLWLKEQEVSCIHPGVPEVVVSSTLLVPDEVCGTATDLTWCHGCCMLCHDHRSAMTG